MTSNVDSEQVNKILSVGPKVIYLRQGSQRIAAMKIVRKAAR